MIRWYRWFRHESLDMRWLSESPDNRRSRCDRRWSHLVETDEPRLQVDSNQGPLRKRGKGKRHEYLCVSCAREVYHLVPPSLLDDRQEKMF